MSDFLRSEVKQRKFGQLKADVGAVRVTSEGPTDWPSLKNQPSHSSSSSSKLVADGGMLGATSRTEAATRSHVCKKDVRIRGSWFLLAGGCCCCSPSGPGGHTFSSAETSTSLSPLGSGSRRRRRIGAAQESMV